MPATRPRKDVLSQMANDPYYDPESEVQRTKLALILVLGANKRDGFDGTPSVRVEKLEKGGHSRREDSRSKAYYRLVGGGGDERPTQIIRTTMNAV